MEADFMVSCLQRIREEYGARTNGHNGVAAC